ncbi:MAG TPA: hypothetical protein VG389_13960 [Myxococcota bacterium]|nr:hypothetical protein [Myxococcota bacterium]
MGRGGARDVFGEPEKLVTIHVSGRSYQVPHDVTVQRALQFISLEYDAITIDYGAYCWNNERGCCVCRYVPKEGARPVEARICRAPVFDGQSVETLPRGMRWVDPPAGAQPAAEPAPLSALPGAAVGGVGKR